MCPSVGQGCRNLADMVENAVQGLVLELGYGWVPHFDVRQGGALLTRLRDLRLNIAAQYHCSIPPIVVRDNPDLEPDEFRFLGNGHVLEKGRLPPDYLLFVDTGDREHELPTGPDSPVFFEPMLNQRLLLLREDAPPHLWPTGLRMVQPAEIFLEYARRVIELEALFNSPQG